MITHDVISTRKAEEPRIHRSQCLTTSLSGVTPNPLPGPLTSAMSIRIPFSLPLYVGGNSENIAKWIVSPAASVPFIVTTKLLLVFAAEFEGARVRDTLAHFVCVPLIIVEFDARISPEEDWRPMVSIPEYDDAFGNR